MENQTSEKLSNESERFINLAHKLVNILKKDIDRRSNKNDKQRNKKRKESLDLPLLSSFLLFTTSFIFHSRLAVNRLDAFR